MLPIRDYNQTRGRPYVNYLLIVINVLVFLWETTLSQQELFDMFRDNSVVPLLFSDAPLTLETVLDGFRSMFFHGSWLHLGSNMLYLWVFGDNIEDRLGKIGYVIFYIACGYAAVLAQVLIDPDSPIPLVGASGAIAGVLGAYLILHPRARIRNLVFLGFLITTVDLPAVLVLAVWFVMQLFSGVASLGVETSGGTAFFAHIGGFVAGLILMGVHRVIFGASRDIRRDGGPIIIEQRRSRH
jgi:membrane associated rhomboid family serine protease